ncbi:hypothetical protein Tco_0404071 [Tanacetum coccineum]
MTWEISQKEPYGSFSSRLAPGSWAARGLLQVVYLSLTDAWPLESSQSEFVCSSYGQNGEEAWMIGSFALEILLELDLDAGFFVHA